jgi:phosphate/sulfate permease
MNKKKEVIRETVWGNVAIGTILVLCGFIEIFQGIEAYKSGTIIPPTIKSGPMTGLQSIVVGCLLTFSGAVLLGYEVLKKIKQKRWLSNH